jgi:hypothetical protein
MLTYLFDLTAQVLFSIKELSSSESGYDMLVNLI